MKLDSFIRDIPDFPKKGIVFKDITPLLSDPAAFKASVDELVKSAQGLGITKVVGIDSRGFIFGSCIAMILNVGFIPIRKKGKLPYKTISESYSLEYGTDTVEMHIDAIDQNDRVFVIDDLLATGGTVGAAVKLVEKTGAKVAKIGFAVELGFLNGRNKISGYDITSLIVY
jgi:adenine phosphoribosyltransferase